MPTPTQTPSKKKPADEYELQHRLYVLKRSRVLAQAELNAAWRQVMAYERALADLNREELAILEQLKQ